MFERRDETLVTLIIYLQTGSMPVSNKHLKYSSRSAAISLADKIINKNFPGMFSEDNCANISQESDDLDESCTIVSTNLMDLELKNTIQSISAKKNSEKHGNNIRAEFKKFDNYQKRTERLELLFNSLRTIKPTSTETERVFSTAGVIKNRIRNRLSFETFNALLFLKYYFIKLK